MDSHPRASARYARRRSTAFLALALCSATAVPAAGQDTPGSPRGAATDVRSDPLGAQDAPGDLRRADRPQAQPAYEYIRQLTDSYTDTPGGVGLLPLALQEAETAELQGRLAARDTVNLAGIQRHAQYALHALDPTLAPGGPGRGYGVRRALPHIVELIELARNSEGTSEALRLHAHYIATAARSAEVNADLAVEAAQRVLSARSLEEGMRLARQLERWTRAVASGLDADGDGRITWRPGEGGVDHTVWHMNLLRNAEGLN